MAKQKVTTKRFDFFSINYILKEKKSYDLKHLDNYFQSIYKSLNEGKDVKPIECYKQVFVGISRVKKVYIDKDTRDDYYWIINFSKVNTEKESSVANVTADINKGRKYYASSEDEGPVTDTVVLLNPSNSVVIIPTNRDGFGKNLLQKFLYKATKKRGAQISIIVDGSSLNKVNLMDKPKEVELRVAKIADVKRIKNPNTTAQNAQNLLLDAESDKVYIKLNSSTAFNGKLKKIIGGLQKLVGNEKIEASTLRVIGEHDDEPQIIDLVSERITFLDENVILDSHGKLTVNNMFESIERAYKGRRKELDLFEQTIRAIEDRNE